MNNITVNGAFLLDKMNKLYKSICIDSKKLNYREISELVIYTLGKHLKINEVCYSEEMFLKDCKKFKPSRKGRNFLYNIQSECNIGNCKPDIDIENYIFKKYGKNTLDMYKSYYDKITYRVHAIVTNIISSGINTKYQIIAYVLGTLAHERQHAIQSKEMIEESLKIKKAFIFNNKGIDFIQCLPPDEVDAINVEIRAVKKYINGISLE